MLKTIKLNFYNDILSKSLCLVMLMILVFSNCNILPQKRFTKLIPPVAQKQPKTFTEHNHTRVDDYFWLKNANDSNVINLLKAENKYTDKMLANTEGLRQTLLNELVGRTQNTVRSAPIKSRGYWYYNRLESGREYPIYCRKKESWNAPEEIILNVDKMAKGFTVFKVTQFQISPDNNFIAYQVDTVGDRNYTIYIKDLKTNLIVERSERMTNNDGFFWANDSKTLFYIQNDKVERGYRAMKHEMGSRFEDDVIVYEEIDNTYWLTLSKSRSRKYMFLTSESTNSTEVAYLDAEKPDQLMRQVIQPRHKDLLYYANHYTNDEFYIFNNYKASNFKLSIAPLLPHSVRSDKTDISEWKDVIPHNDSSLLMKYEILDNYIVYQNRVNGLIKINIIDRKTEETQSVDFGEDVYNTEFYVADFDNFNLDSIRFNYQSLKTPISTFRYDIKTKKKTLITQNTIDNYNPKKYETKRLWVKARDGVEVPVSIVYKKGRFYQKGKNPLLLTAYGAYGYNFEAEFSSEIISLLDRGFVYAIAHVRGGQELGRHWYEEGKTNKKKNTFNDFIDCADYLIENKYVAKDKLCGDGISAGGLLLAVALNERPDLWRVLTPDLPWTDAITDAFDLDLPLTTVEWDEWGDARNKEIYDYMLGWSPYDNLKPTNYPAILTNSALLDTQVPFYSPTKWVYKLRENNTGTNPILHRCMFDTGHSGPSGRYEKLREVAVKYAFILKQLGIDE